MTLISKRVVTAALLLAMATPASAMLTKAQCLSIYSAAGSNSGIVVSVRGNTVTVSGFVEHHFEVEAIRRAAIETGIENVVMRVFTEN